MGGRLPIGHPPSSQKLIQVDLDPEILGAHRGTDLAIQGDVKLFMAQLIERFETKIGADPQVRTNAPKRMATYRKACRMIYARNWTRAFGGQRGAPQSGAGSRTSAGRYLTTTPFMVIDGGRTAAWCHYFHQVRRPQYPIWTHRNWDMWDPGRPTCHRRQSGLSGPPSLRRSWGTAPCAWVKGKSKPAFG